MSRPKLNVFAQVHSKNPKAPGYEEVPVKNDGGIIVIVGKTKLHIATDGENKINIRTVDGVIVLQPRAGNSVNVTEEPL